MRRAIRFLAFLLPIAPSVAHSQAPGRIDSLVQRSMKEQHVPGIAIAVVKNGKPVYAKGYGFANLELRARATPETVFEIGSLTKQFTSMLVMQLVEKGKLSLDDRASKFIPKLDPRITIRQLLNHTSGLKSYTAMPEILPRLREDVEPAQILTQPIEAGLDFEPGKSWDYSNSGYVALGMIIEKAIGKSYRRALKDMIFNPLRMSSSYYNDWQLIIPNRAAGYEVDGERNVNAQYISMSWPYSAGAVSSTVLDLARWDSALYTDALASRASLRKMWTPEGAAVKAFYGFGWIVLKLGSSRMLAHGGGINGFSSYILRLPDQRMSFIVLANNGSADTESIAIGIARLYFPKLAP